MKAAILILLLSALFVTGCGRETHSSADKRRFSEHGLAFDYPQSMTIAKSDGPVRLISLTSVNDISVRIINYPTRTLSPEQLQTIALDGFRTSTAGSDDSKNLKESESEQYIAGERHTGTTFNDLWRGNERITQFYTFPFGDGVLSVLLQHTAETSSEAVSIYDIVLESMTGP